MTGEFPSITEVFVTERDYFLAHTLFMSARTIAEHSEQSGDGPIIVVGVVGMGHVPGICRNFGKTREDEFLRVGRYVLRFQEELLHSYTLKVPKPNLTSLSI